jgi:hypothetical protein
VNIAQQLGVIISIAHGLALYILLFV